LAEDIEDIEAALLFEAPPKRFTCVVNRNIPDTVQPLDERTLVTFSPPGRETLKRAIEGMRCH